MQKYWSILHRKMLRQNSETAIDVMFLTGAYTWVGLLILQRK